ncbi:neuronal acetylcholine receptor subunit alpha-7 [Octopus bimaculoides]|nr:neuronal acetylcholine receptor subunit alpha-7 [Octopus bimaculoides]
MTQIYMWILPLFTYLILPKGSLQSAEERRLLETLFASYNPLERPVANHTDTLLVLFGITLQQIIDVDEKNQNLASNLWLNIKWNDTNLVWNPEDFGNITLIRLPPKKLWKPDILMYNSANEVFDATYPTNVLVSYNGFCHWVPPGMFKSTCQIDIAWFPFDDQKCTLKFGSWTHDGRYLDLQLDGDGNGDTSSFIRNGEWKLIAVPGSRNVVKYDCCPQIYLDATYTIHIRRRTLYYGFNIIIPCVLISALSLLLFILPPDAGEKISLGVTILLSLMVFLLLVAETMPPTSDAVPLIGVYFACIMVTCSVSVVLTVWVLNYHHRSPETHTMPDWVRKGICGWLACVLRMSRPGVERLRPLKKHTVQNCRAQELRLIEKSTRSLLANTVDIEDDFKHDSNPNGGVKPPLPVITDASGRGELITILKEVQKITKKYKDDEDDEEIKGDWKFAAMVIDRLCFIICGLFTMLSTIIILTSAPHVFA